MKKQLKYIFAAAAVAAALGARGETNLVAEVARRTHLSAYAAVLRAVR